MADDIQSARSAIESWHLGQTSARYESSAQGAGVISTGRGDHGGVSYGAYQLSTKMGTLREYLDQSSYGEQFSGLSPATPAFNAKWRELAKTDPGFSQDQHDFIGRSHYGEQLDSLKAKGLDLSGRGRAVQDALWSTSVQFRGLTPRIFAKGLEEKFGRDHELSKLSDQDIVEAVQDYKIAHNSALFRSSQEWQPGLLRRANAEKADLVRLAVQEEVLRSNGLSVTLLSPPVATDRGGSRQVVQSSRIVLTTGDRGGGVRDLQLELNRLGYPGAQGSPLIVDGDFGSHTERAVKAFQLAHGLRVDGAVGPDTRAALLKAERSPLLSERTHPDHALFLEVRAGARQLPPGTFREGPELDNTSAALASKSKQAGLSHVDHVMLNTRGDGVIVVQGNLHDPARQFISVDKTQAASQSVERSTDELAAAYAANRQHAQVQAQAQHMEHRSGLVMGIRQ